MAALIDLDQVTLTYPTLDGNSVIALKDVSMTVAPNEFTVLVGPSGCGKSTLLKLVAGLQKPTCGKVSLAEQARERAPGMVFQTPNLMEWRTVMENVLFPVEVLKKQSKAYAAAAGKLLATAGLTGFEDKYPRELSGGMRQRVAICRALIHDPAVLLMDEPFAALDAMTRDEMCLELLRIWEQSRNTVLFVTHSISEAVLLADRVVVMTPRPGRIARIVEIALPRPRTVDMEFTPEFQGYVAAIRSEIYQGKR